MQGSLLAASIQYHKLSKWISF